MRSWLQLFWMSLLIAALAPPAGAQTASIETFNTGEANQCPGEEELAAIPGAGRYVVSNGFGYTFVLAPRIEAFQGPEFAARAAAGRLPGFADRVTLYWQAKDTTGRVLVRYGLKEPFHCTWIAQENLLLPEQGRDIMSAFADGPKPKLVGELDERDPTNRLTAKAVLNNLNFRGAGGIKVYDAPNAQEPIAELKLFEFFSVYDRQPGTARGERNLNRHYLIGKREAGDDSLKGWVHEDDIYLWPSRMAVDWNGSGLGGAWLDNDQREIAGEPQITAPRSVAEEAHHRHPVLSMNPVSKVVQEEAKKIGFGPNRTSLRLSHLVSDYQSAIKVEACKNDGSQCLSSEELERLRKEYQRILESLRRIDILFLIDSTESMGAYFPATARAVSSYLSKAPGREREGEFERSVRIGIAAYGDYEAADNSPSDPFLEMIVDFTEVQELDERLDALDEYAVNFTTRAPRDRHQDKPEASLAALRLAAEESDWRHDAGLKIIVHLADHGSRRAGETTGAAGHEVTETITPAEVRGALDHHGVRYIAISVLGRPDDNSPEATAARQAFLVQAQEILDGQGYGSRVIKSYEVSASAETPDERRKAVTSALDEAVDPAIFASVKARLMEECAREKSSAGGAGDYCRRLEELDQQADPTIARIGDKTLHQKSLTEEQIGNIFSRRETVLYALLPPVVTTPAGDEAETLTYWMAAERGEIKLLASTMDELCDLIVPGEQNIDTRLPEAIQKWAGVASADEIRGTALVATLLSLPFVERLDIIGTDVDDVVRAVSSGDHKETYRIRGEFCRTAFLLKQMLQNKRLVRPEALTSRGDGMVEVDPQDLQDYDWEVNTDNGERFYYIPVEYLP